MMPKITQGMMTVIVGNCGISASPVTLNGDPPDPMNLLGDAVAFRYRTFAAYVEAVDGRRRTPGCQHQRADRAYGAAQQPHGPARSRPTGAEIAGMRAQLEEALDHGALGLSSGLAYGSAFNAPPEEIEALAEPLAKAGALYSTPRTYTTHMRIEFDAILDAMDEAYRVGRHAPVLVVISHLKCVGLSNWGRSVEVLRSIETTRAGRPIGCDCYPYNRSSSTFDLKQVTGDIDITITWSTPHPEMAGKLTTKWRTNGR